MLSHFTSNDLLSRHLSKKEVTDQFVSILESAHTLGLDWYFTEVPDLRCGRKEINSARASSVCFRFWFKNQDELLIPSGRRLGFQGTEIPLKPSDFLLLKRHIQKFAADNPATRQNGGFFPDQYHTLDTGANQQDPLNSAISHMINTMLRTVENSNGQQVTRIMKNKETVFTEEEAKLYLRKLFNSQDGLCAITGIQLQFPDNANDRELVCSLDRKDSNGNYEPDNLQIVCKFVNRWKSDSPDNEFRRLIDLVKSRPY
jgi:hypothetical protein